MSDRKTQLDIILEKLAHDGEISRNWCLRNYISRLSGRVLDLRREGYEFEVERRGNDYVYVLTFDPTKQPKQLSLV